MRDDEAMQIAFERAVALAKGQSALSRLLLSRGVKFSQQLIHHHLHKSRRCPAEHVLAVEAVTGVSRHQLRPDVFGPEPELNSAQAA